MAKRDVLYDGNKKMLADKIAITALYEISTLYPHCCADGYSCAVCFAERVVSAHKVLLKAAKVDARTLRPDTRE